MSFLQFFMETQGSIDKPAAGAPGTKFFQRIFSRFDDSRVFGQVQIVVAGYRYDIATVNGDVGTIHGFDFAEIGVDAEVLGLIRSFISVTFLTRHPYPR